MPVVVAIKSMAKAKKLLSVILLFLSTGLSYAGNTSFGLKAGCVNWFNAPIVDFSGSLMNNHFIDANGHIASVYLMFKGKGKIGLKLIASYTRVNYYRNDELPYVISIYLNRLQFSFQPEWQFAINQIFNPYIGLGPTGIYNYMTLNNNGVLDFYTIERNLLSAGVLTTLGNRFILDNKLSFLLDLSYSLTYPIRNNNFYKNLYKKNNLHILNLEVEFAYKI